MQRFIIICVLVSMSVVLFKNKTEAAVYADTYGFSAKGMSMGNAMTAVVNDWSSVYYNMAGLGRTRGVEIKSGEEGNDEGGFDIKMRKSDKGETENKKVLANQLAISYLHSMPQFNIDITRDDGKGNPLSTEAADDLDMGAILIGIAFDINTLVDLPQSVLSSCRLGVGLGLVRGGYAQKMNDIDERTHNFLRYGREAQRLVILVGLGLGFFDDFIGIGGGVNMTFQGQSNNLISDTEVGPSEQTPLLQNRLDLKTVPKPVAGIYIQPGRIFSLLEGLQIGAMYRHETYVQIDPFQTRNILKTGQAAMDLTLALFDFYTPYTFSVGIAYNFESLLGLDLTLSLEGQYEMWSRFMVSSAHNTYYNELMMDPATANPEDYAFPGTKDIIVIKAGINYHIFSWMNIYLGYYYQPSFLDDDELDGVYNWMDNEMHAGSIGFTFTIPRFGFIKAEVAITLGFQAQYLVDRSITKNNPTGFNPNYSYGGWCPTGIIEISLRF